MPGTRPMAIMIAAATANARGIIVTNTPGVLTEDTADMTMALILAVPRWLRATDPRLAPETTATAS